MNKFQVILSDEELAVLAKMGYAHASTAAQEQLTDVCAPGVEEMHTKMAKNLLQAVESASQADIDSIKTLLNVDDEFKPVDPNAL